MHLISAYAQPECSRIILQQLHNTPQNRSGSHAQRALAADEHWKVAGQQASRDQGVMRCPKQSFPGFTQWNNNMHTGNLLSCSNLCTTLQ
jgi:hypothetical protein